MDEKIKEILKEILDIMKEKLASDHIYTEYTTDYSDECKDSVCNCAYRCSHSKELYERLSLFEEKLQ